MALFYDEDGKLCSAYDNGGHATHTVPAIEPPTPMGKLYPQVLPQELEPHYSRHVAAMTSESLHSKAAIAEQLAWRDKCIAELENELALSELQIAAGGSLLLDVQQDAIAKGKRVTELENELETIHAKRDVETNTGGEARVLETMFIRGRGPAIMLDPAGPLPEEGANLFRWDGRIWIVKALAKNARGPTGMFLLNGYAGPDVGDLLKWTAVGAGIDG